VRSFADSILLCALKEVPYHDSTFFTQLPTRPMFKLKEKKMREKPFRTFLLLMVMLALAAFAFTACTTTPEATEVPEEAV
jgi:hypothetical protein